MPQFLEHSGTSWKGQKVKHQQSLIDRLDPRLRVVLVTLFAFVTVLSENFWVLTVATVAGLVLALLAQLNLKRTLRRVIAMDMFMIFLIILLPFTTPGRPGSPCLVSRPVRRGFCTR